MVIANTSTFPSTLLLLLRNAAGRTRPRLRTRHCRPGQSQPHRLDPLRRPHARIHGIHEPALKIYTAVDQVIREGKYLTPDLGGSATTTQCEEEILKKINA